MRHFTTADFWVVALVGQECVWYNDIEDGFNISRYAEMGLIGGYRCEQADLAPCIRSYFRFFTEAIASAAQRAQRDSHRVS